MRNLFFINDKHIYTNKQISPVMWVGGKGRILNKLLPLIPYSMSYIEPFGGGGSVFFARNKSNIEVYNDKFEHLVNLMCVLRDRDKNKELNRLCRYTLYARKEKYYAWNILKNKLYKDDVEQAWAFFITMNQGFGGKYEGSWGYAITDSGDSVSKYNTKLGLFNEWLNRLTDVQIECKDAVDIIKIYDNLDSVIYCDPSYITDTRSSKNLYENEMTDIQHELFLNTCITCKGAVVISGYENDLYNDILFGWDKVNFTTTCNVAGRAKNSNLKGEGNVNKNQKRVEVVYRNKRALYMLNKNNLF